MNKVVYLDNYMALLACIISETTVDQAINKIALQTLRTKYVVKKKRASYSNNRAVAVKVVDVKNNETHEFKAYKDCAEELKMAISTVYNRCNDGKLYKNQYLFSRIEGGNESEEINKA